MNKNDLSQKLKNQNIEDFDILVAPPAPVGNYVAVKKVGNLAYISGQMPIASSGTVLTKNESDSVNFGYAASKLAMANILKQLIYCTDIEEVYSIVRVDGYFNNKKGNDLAKMLDGASDLISNILGKEGTHARTVFSVHSLPYDAFLEIVVIAEIK